ncbi:hypothetical protein ABZU75_02850 [Streptosporangium sp. NPDC005286]|uniref:hypothetical protein n=1 Tax=Streptosporangium sp. NPDC005286 TaxID=3154463 RepID=UPI0033BF81F7
MKDSRCPIVELRQYTLHEGGRDVLIDLFEREFIESQEAAGMTVIGQFRDLDAPNRFVRKRSPALPSGSGWRPPRDHCCVETRSPSGQAQAGHACDVGRLVAFANGCVRMSFTRTDRVERDLR